MFSEKNYFFLFDGRYKIGEKAKACLYNNIEKLVDIITEKLVEATKTLLINNSALLYKCFVKMGIITVF